MIFIDVNQEKKEKYVIDKKDIYVFFFYNYSGKLEIEMRKSGAKAYIFGLYHGRNKDKFVIETSQRHAVANSFSELLIKGVFEHESRFLHQGLVKIEKKAQKSQAYQKSQNLLISNKGSVESRPFLEILTGDVSCCHATNINGLPKDELFVLQNRGLSKNMAKKLLINGFVSEIFNRINALTK